MRTLLNLAFIIALAGISSALAAQTAPTASLPGGGSSFVAGGSPPPHFEQTVSPGDTLSMADILIEDATDSDNVSVTGVSATTLTGITPPTTSGPALQITLSWTGTVDTGVTPGDYDWTIDFEDDEGTPLTGQIVVRITVTDEVPQHSAGTDQDTGDGSVSTPYAPVSQAINSTFALDLCDVTDANTGQTLSVSGVTAGGSNPSSAITITNNSPAAGGTLTLTATAASALAIADIGTFDFAVDVTDSGANTITINLRVVVDPPVVSVSSTGSPDENGTVTGTYNFTCTPAPGSSFSVNIQMSGTATFGGSDDYTLSGAAVNITTAAGGSGPWDGTIDISAGGSATLTLTPVDDSSVEGAEDAILTIQAGTGYAVAAGPNDTATLSIADDDSISATVATSSTPSEPSTDGFFTITLSQASATDTTVNFTITGAATPGTDYVLSSTNTFNFVNGTGVGDVLITAGNTSAVIDIQVSDDATPEGAEDVVLTINAGSGYTVGTPSNDSMDIADDDSLGVSVGTSGTPSEAGPATGTYTLTASSAVPADTTVNFTMTGTASFAATGGDYTLSSTGTLSFNQTNGTGTIVIANGNTSVDITLTPIDDASIEGNETAILTINTGSGYTVGTPSSDTHTIADNDVPPASATLSAGSGNPGSQTAGPGETATALVFRVSETAGGTDYDVTSVTVTFNLSNNTGGVGEAMMNAVALRRGGSQLASVTNGSAGWSSTATTVTVSFTGFTPSTVSAGSSADFAIVVAFNAGAVPSPNPAYSATIDSTDVNSGTAITGGPVSGGVITLREKLPDDPFAEDDSDSCDLATRGGPAWPVLLLLAAASAMIVWRRRTA